MEQPPQLSEEARLHERNVRLIEELAEKNPELADSPDSPPSPRGRVRAVVPLPPSPVRRRSEKVDEQL